MPENGKKDGAFSDCQKRLFDSLVDGGASSPATATPSRFHLNPSDSGREICKEAIFHPENKIFLLKNQLRARRTRRRARFYRLRCVAFSTVCDPGLCPGFYIDVKRFPAL